MAAKKRGRAPSYSKRDYNSAVTFLKAGNTIAHVMAKMGLSQGVVTGIKRKAGLAKTRAPRGQGKTKKAKRSPVDGLLRPFLSQIAVAKSEKEPSEPAILARLRGELKGIQTDLAETARRHKALSLARGHWQLRILRISKGENDPGAIPPPVPRPGTRKTKVRSAPKRKKAKRKTSKRKAKR